MKNLLEKIKVKITNPCVIYKLLGVSIIISSILYYIKLDIINFIASILALPSFILSIIVLNVVNIKPKDLDNYYHLRIMHDNEKKEYKVSAFKAFDDKLNEIKDLNNKYKLFYNNTLSNTSSNHHLKNHCEANLEELKKFFSETKNYIFKVFLTDLKDLGGLKSIVEVKVSIVESDAENLLHDYLYKIPKELFQQDKLNDEDIILLKSLFDDDGIMSLYLKTCTRAYELKEGGKNNEI